LLAVFTAAALVLTACSNDGPKFRAPGSTTVEGQPVAAAISAPKDGAASVSTATEIAVTSQNATKVVISLASASGEPVTGQMRPDGSSWLPDHQLDYATSYTATVTATGDDGKNVTATATFTTMDEPDNLAYVRSQIGDDQVVGVGAMLVLNFGANVPENMRAAVQKRLFVTSEPAQEGIWNWFAPNEVHYRPRQFWQTGTKISMRAATGGLKLSDTAYGRNDLTVQASVVTDKLEIKVENTTKMLTVFLNDKPIKTMPVSLGRPSFPSSSGHMVIMVKNEWEWFDSTTYGLPLAQGGYREKVYWDMRLTWGGEYMHAAPWSKADQGKRNVSHGCVNLTTENAKWLYDRTHIGDPVTVSNTEVHLKWGNGWTDWDRPWEEYVKGSALPYQPVGAPAVTSSPS
jgi:lipoprotein-anchoring transpeptidase ErfK/SrfK